ncbi:MAG: TonB-dependent receptor [Bacteroidales bacterium]|nr:TonB-dependent receptor [Bacteroidales bacterium]
MKKIRLFFTAVMVLLTAGLANAQTAKVTGTVYDADNGEKIPFASVRVKDTMTGASVGADGTYSISVPTHGNPVLVFSFVGYKTAEVAVDGRSVVDCALEADATALDDVVVVAYGSARKEAVTGSVSSVKGETLASAPVTSVDKALSGKLAGVQITAASGQPGAASQIRIRGTSSINASNTPLWVVDGIPVISSGTSEMTNTSNGIATINPNDIESITVLKDAAAAAVYGSRAANGVILVTTKSGKQGRAQFDARAKYGVSWLQSDSGFRMMNASELLSYQRDAAINAGHNPDDPTSTYYRPMSLLTGELTNWMNHFTRPGILQEYEISARGGNSKGTYYSSVSYHKNDGVFYGIDYSKLQARVNADYKLLKNLETGVRVNVAYTDQNDVPMQSLYYANASWAGLTLLPWIPKYDENGNHNVNIPSNSYSNPRATAMYDDQWSKSYKFNGTMFLRWEPVKHLVIETRNSAEAAFTQDRRYWNPLSDGSGSDATLQATKSQYTNLTTSNTINYSNVFGGYHSLRVLAGQEANAYKYEYSYVYAPGVNPDIPYQNTAPQSNVESEVGFSNETLMSFFGIADYNYDNRYFVQATIREDGSSLFGSKNKWGLFWSASASWNLSNEKWMDSTDSWLDLLKVRASYGLNGNNGINPYKAYGVYSSTQYNNGVGMVPSQPSNDYLSWEKNSTWNVGLDFGFFGNRLRGNFDVYDRVTKDMLLDVNVPQTTGFSTNFKNAGSMKNSGVEFQLDADIISTPDFLWTAGFNLAHNKTEILDLAVEPDANGEERIANGSFVYHVVGKSMYTYWVSDYYGVNPANGEALWVTEDGSLSNNYNDARKYYAGSPEPKLLGGFNTSLNWKGLSLSAFFEFKAGCHVLILNEHSYLNSDGAQMTMNQMASSLNYWKKPGDVGVNPKPIAGNSTSSSTALSDRWLERGDYLRIKDVTLSYSLPQVALDKLHIKGLRFYVSGLNLYCFNDVNFWDPEMGVTGAGAGIYPLTKSFVGGVELSF